MVYIFRRLKCVHVYECVSHGREWWYTLHLSSDVRFCLKDLQPSKENRRNPYPSWWKYGAGKPYPGGVNSHLMNDIVYKPFNAAPTASVVILREKNHKKNLSGGDEMYIPPRLLHGLIPSLCSIIINFGKMKAAKVRIKGCTGTLSIKLLRNDFIIILEIDSLNTQEASQFVAQKYEYNVAFGKSIR